MTDNNTPATNAAPKKDLFKEVMPLKNAQKEINAWLDNKKVPPYKREKNEDQVEALVNALRYGHITIGDSKQITQKLVFPISDDDGGVALSELRFEPRLRVEAINLQLKSVKWDDTHGSVMAHVTALTGKSKGLIGKLDTEDYSISRAIATFFM